MSALNRTRPEMLAELADCINGLTEIRTESTPYEIEERDGQIRRRVMRRHVETFPCLLDSLVEAMQPAGATEQTAAAGFESRPSAELEPIAVLAQITSESGTWLRAFNLKPRATLADTLHALVGAKHTEVMLANLVKDARGWLNRAETATGWANRAFTLNEPCPQCGRKNSLTVNGTMTNAVCTRCGVDWPENYFGLLGQMIMANQHVETMTVATCDDLHGESACYRKAGHVDKQGLPDEHRDARGHYWLSVPDETISA